MLPLLLVYYAREITKLFTVKENYEVGIEYVLGPCGQGTKK